MPEFITFKTFNEAPQAWVLIDLLDENGIEYESEEISLSPDLPYHELYTQYIVKIHPDNFTRVAELLKTNSTKKDPPLFNFTDAELMEILAKPDEWRAVDYELARERLAERGIKVSEDTIARLKKDRAMALKAHKQSQTGWIVAGYLFALAGGVLGLLVGWHLVFQKRTLPDGWWAYEYNEFDRRQGRFILWLSTVISITTFFYT